MFYGGGEGVLFLDAAAAENLFLVLLYFLFNTSVHLTYCSALKESSFPKGFGLFFASGIGVPWTREGSPGSSSWIFAVLHVLLFFL